MDSTEDRPLPPFGASVSTPARRGEIEAIGPIAATTLVGPVEDFNEELMDEPVFLRGKMTGTGPRRTEIEPHTLEPGDMPSSPQQTYGGMTEDQLDQPAFDRRPLYAGLTPSDELVTGEDLPKPFDASAAKIGPEGQAERGNSPIFTDPPELEKIPPEKRPFAKKLWNGLKLAGEGFIAVGTSTASSEERFRAVGAGLKVGGEYLKTAGVEYAKNITHIFGREKEWYAGVAAGSITSLLIQGATAGNPFAASGGRVALTTVGAFGLNTFLERGYIKDKETIKNKFTGQDLKDQITALEARHDKGKTRVKNFMLGMSAGATYTSVLELGLGFAGVHLDQIMQEKIQGAAQAVANFNPGEVVQNAASTVSSTAEATQNAMQGVGAQITETASTITHPIELPTSEALQNAASAVASVNPGEVLQNATNTITSINPGEVASNAAHTITSAPENISHAVSNLTQGSAPETIVVTPAHPTPEVVAMPTATATPVPATPTPISEEFLPTGAPGIQESAPGLQVAAVPTPESAPFLATGAQGIQESVISTHETIATNMSAEALGAQHAFSEVVAPHVGEHLDMTTQAVNEALTAQGVDPSEVSARTMEQMRMAAQHQLEAFGNESFAQAAQETATNGQIDMTHISNISERGSQLFNEALSQSDHHDKLVQAAHEALNQHVEADMEVHEIVKSAMERISPEDATEHIIKNAETFGQMAQSAGIDSPFQATPESADFFGAHAMANFEKISTFHEQVVNSVGLSEGYNMPFSESELPGIIEHARGGDQAAMNKLVAFWKFIPARDGITRLSESAIKDLLQSAGVAGVT